MTFSKRLFITCKYKAFTLALQAIQGQNISDVGCGICIVKSWNLRDEGLLVKGATSRGTVDRSSRSSMPVSILEALEVFPCQLT